MNNKKRERLRDALSLLSKAEGIVDTINDQEQDSLDSYPENLQGTDAYSDMENAVDCLSDAVDKITEAKELITEAIG